MYFFIFVHSEVEKNLSAARRKDLDESEYSSNMNRQRPSSEIQNRNIPKSVNRSQSAKMLVSGTVFQIVIQSCFLRLGLVTLDIARVNIPE